MPQSLTPIASNYLEIPTNTSRSNGCEKLLPLLSPLVVNAPRDPNIWTTLNSCFITWLINTASKSPYFNSLVLYSIIFIESCQPANQRNQAQRLNSFLRWAIPNRHPNVTSLKPVPDLYEYFGIPPKARGYYATTAYTSFQFHMDRYLSITPKDKCEGLIKYLLPRLVMTGKLIKLSTYHRERSRQYRKSQVFPLIEDLPRLLIEVRRRYSWLEGLESNYRFVIELVKKGEINLPYDIHYKDILNEDDLIFRVWDRRTWIFLHKDNYSKNYSRSTLQNGVDENHDRYFLQYIGNRSDAFWFQHAIEVGAFGQGELSEETIEYLKEINIISSHNIQNYILTPARGFSGFLIKAKSISMKTPGETRAIFPIEPLLVGAAIGLFSFTCFVQTGMRLGELMQIEASEECIFVEHFKKFDDISEQWKMGPSHIYFNLFPKGKTNRERFIVTHEMCEAMQILFDLRERYSGKGSLVGVPAQSMNNFSHSRRFLGSHKFLLQWDRQHLTNQTIVQCLDFILLEHNIRDSNNLPIRITPHILRHGVAGLLRQKGIPLDDIMALLHQININVTDYYSKLSPDALYARIAPFLTQLMEKEGIDPTLIRRPEDMINSFLESLKRYGALRNTPGGDCGNFSHCEVQFKCASCPDYHPDPDRMTEIDRMIEGYKQKINIDMANNNQLEAANDKGILRDWTRRKMEAQALLETAIEPLATQNMLNYFSKNKPIQKYFPNYLSVLLRLEKENK